MSDVGKMIIAIDFDGTIVEHRYPAIGCEKPNAFKVLHKLQTKGHFLILWTYRNGIYLEKAIAFCKENGLGFYAINESFPGEASEGGFSRKIYADIYIDDRIVGGFPGWLSIYQQLYPADKEFIKQFQNNSPAVEPGKDSRYLNTLLNQWRNFWK